MVWYGTPSISARVISAGAPGFASRGRENDVPERERGDDGREGEEQQLERMEEEWKETKAELARAAWEKVDAEKR
jgi:hypothetical protein